MAEFSIREASLDDKQAVLDCNTNVYDGFDYLSEFYDHILLSENSKSFVLLHGSKIIGFNSGILLDDGHTVLSRAARINPKYEGKGLYRRLDQHLSDWAISKGVRVKAQTGTSRNSLASKPSFWEKNKILISKNVYICTFDSIKIDTAPVECGLSEINDSLLTEYINSKEIAQYLFPEERIIVEFIPYRLISSNVPLIREQGVFTKAFSDVRAASGVYSGLLSFGTMYKIPAFSYRYSIDIYGTDIETLSGHIEKHLLRLKQKTQDAVAVVLYLSKSFPAEIVEKMMSQYGGITKLDDDVEEASLSHGFYSKQFLFEKDL